MVQGRSREQRGRKLLGEKDVLRTFCEREERQIGRESDIEEKEKGEWQKMEQRTERPKLPCTEGCL